MYCWRGSPEPLSPAIVVLYANNARRSVSNSSSVKSIMAKRPRLSLSVYIYLLLKCYRGIKMLSHQIANFDFLVWTRAPVTSSILIHCRWRTLRLLANHYAKLISLHHIKTFPKLCEFNLFHLARFVIFLLIFVPNLFGLCEYRCKYSTLLLIYAHNLVIFCI